MSDVGVPRAGIAYPRLVPSSLLPPEDPAGGGAQKRTLRDWLVDLAAFLIAIGLGLVVLNDSIESATDHVSDGAQFVDLLIGSVACLALWWRRRWPIAVGILTAALGAFSAFAVMASVIGLFTAAVHRRATLTLVPVAMNLAAGVVFTAIRPQDEGFWVAQLFGAIACVVVTAWGMFVRARRQLVWTLRARAERAEAEQRMLAEQARLAERTRIAREMHDVLAHRISLLALHAGGLQLRPELPSEQVRDTATLLRDTAHQALEELRGVIGVLRDENTDGLIGDGAESAPAQPQPTLRDIPRLVEDTRRTGAKIDFAMTVPDGCEPPEPLGRDAYRIVQEALTNVAKHARGTATTVQVSGAPGAELRVDIRNRLPIAAPTGLPGSGSGLLGLQERVALTGGTLESGPNGAGEFVVDARLAWRR